MVTGGRIRAWMGLQSTDLSIRWLTLPLTAAVLLGGCSARVSTRDIHSYDPRRRALAIRHIAERNDRREIPRLVDRLEDEDQAVRLFAIQALERMTGIQSDYKYFLPPSAQQASIAKWRADTTPPQHMQASAAPPATAQTATGPRDKRHHPTDEMRP